MDKIERIMTVALVASLTVFVATSALLMNAAYGQYGQEDLEAVLQAMEHPDVPPTPEQMAEQRVIALVEESGLVESGAYNASVVTLEDAGEAEVPAASEVPAAASEPQQPINIYITMPPQETSMLDELAKNWPVLLAVAAPAIVAGIVFLYPMIHSKLNHMSIESSITSKKMVEASKSDTILALERQYFNAVSNRISLNAAGGTEELADIIQSEEAAKKKE